MKIALIADAFPPMRTSAAVQIRDLSRELLNQGHVPFVFVPDAEISEPILQENFDGVCVVRVRTPKTKNVGYLRRTLAEFVQPYLMGYRIMQGSFAEETWDGVVWYSPTIFFSPLVKRLTRRGSTPSYLILRDIFPEWAVNVGLMSRGIPYRIFKMIEKRQYLTADVIGVQAQSEVGYIARWLGRKSPETEVLQNWLDEPTPAPCSLTLHLTNYGERRIFVYAGNMGKAQNPNIFIDLAERMLDRRNAYFVFVGRGSEVQQLKINARNKHLDNVAFYDEVDPDEVPDLLTQADFGLLALDSRLTTHNIPGKFLAYMQAGVPILGRVNPGNDLVEIVRTFGVGTISTSENLDDLEKAAALLLSMKEEDGELSARCRNVSTELFSASRAASQIVSAFERRLH